MSRFFVSVSLVAGALVALQVSALTTMHELPTVRVVDPTPSTGVAFLTFVKSGRCHDIFKKHDGAPFMFKLDQCWIRFTPKA